MNRANMGKQTKSGGFPDLTGDGKVTKKDILKGRGVKGFSAGGGIKIRGTGAAIKGTMARGPMG